MSTKVDPEFEKFESKVDQVMKILEEMNNSDKSVQEEGLRKADDYLQNKDWDKFDEDNFIVRIKDNRTVINNKHDEDNGQGSQYMDKFTFMQQLEEDTKKRAEIKEEREKIAHNFRCIGNEAFRMKDYAKAITMYSKAIDHVKDSPILYNNRALSYIKLKIYKRAIIDCDYVINKLDDKNLRAWLYRATGYYHLEDEKNFEKSIKIAKKNNSKEIDYIEKFVDEMKSNTIL